jgi:uncharacterized membrane protein YgcG
VPLFGPPFTLASAAAVHPCARRGGRWSPRADVLFLVLTGSATVDRAKAVKETWGARLGPALVLIGDAPDAALGVVTLPGLAGKPGRPAAPHRTLQGLMWAMAQPEYADYAWVMMVDDDTWVNVDELAPVLHGWAAADAPLLFGYVWDRPTFDATPGGGRSWPSGAAMLATRAAADVLAEALYSDACPYEPENDLTVGRCAWATGVGLVHVPAFAPEAHIAEPSGALAAQGHDGDVRAAVTVHRATPDRMRAWQAIVDGHGRDAALVARAPAWPVAGGGGGGGGGAGGGGGGGGGGGR